MPTGDSTVLGIDPGSRVTGFGVARLTGSRLVHLKSGVIRPRSSCSLEQRLHAVHAELLEIIDETHPDSMAIETIFFAKNVRSALLLAHARGVALLAAAERGLPVHEYSPSEVKSASVGYGRASKDQVTDMIGRLFGLSRTAEAKPHDATDALAVALCHLHSSRLAHRVSAAESRVEVQA